MKTIVSHALKTGNIQNGFLYAENFSNVLHSNKSSLGAYLTKNTYYGRFGYSLVLKGLDKKCSQLVKVGSHLLAATNQGVYEIFEDSSVLITDEFD